MLETPEAKKMYRELSMKHHPDRGGSTEMMRKINAARGGKDVAGDAAMKRLYRELETKKQEGPKKKAYDDTKKEEPKFDFNKFQDMVWDAIVELNDIAPSVKYHIISRKSKDKIILNVFVSFTALKDNKIVKDNINFSIFNAEKLKTKEAIVSAVIDKFNKY